MSAHIGDGGNVQGACVHWDSFETDMIELCTRAGQMR